MPFPSDVSVIVCVKNSASLLPSCLDSIIINNPGEIIVIDGLSDDSTLQILDNYDDLIVCSDSGLGLSYARRLGVLSSSKPFVLFVGPDNQLPPTFISQLLSLFIASEYDAATVQSRVFSPSSYWDLGADQKWQYLMGNPGPREVIGTPTIYSKYFLSKINYLSEDLGPCDDTDLGYRASSIGLKLGLLPLCIYEQNGLTLKSTWSRYVWYGTGDHKFFSKYYRDWSIIRSIFSLSHPLRQTISYCCALLFSFKLGLIPWFLLTMTARYYGWLYAFLRSLRPLI